MYTRAASRLLEFNSQNPTSSSEETIINKTLLNIVKKTYYAILKPVIKHVDFHTELTVNSGYASGFNEAVFA
jgi:hypothetical protein